MASLKFFRPVQFNKNSFYSLLNLSHKPYKYCQITHFHRSSLLYGIRISYKHDYIYYIVLITYNIF